MRTPVIIVAGQGPTGYVTEELLKAPGTVLVEHQFDGHVVRRRTVTAPHGIVNETVAALELAHGCVSCTVRNDLLIYLRLLHRRDDVNRIVVHLEPWMEPEPICWALNHVRVRVGPGYIDGPAARDVAIAGVVTCIEAGDWLTDALGDDELPDGRTVAQVAVGQAEFADVVVVTHAEPVLLAVCRRLAPRAQLVTGPDMVEDALRSLWPDARLGRADEPHGPLLAGQPSLKPEGLVQIVEFNARRPFHPERLHDAIDHLLDGVIRTRGRMWLANRPGHVMWLESAGGGLRVSNAGRWIAAMTVSEAAYEDRERRALADLMWDNEFGDRHTAMTILVCGARADDVNSALNDALLTDDEFAARGDWAGYPDPFGDWHQEPCTRDDVTVVSDGTDHGMA
ncbi:cobalamin synthesis protein [Mycobacteroides abscessus subsp. abscessus]|nr:cobalamin synthesis protein [Mycobacteroides abscessus subsp. abscessus]